LRDFWVRGILLSALFGLTWVPANAQVLSATEKLTTYEIAANGLIEELEEPEKAPPFSGLRLIVQSAFEAAPAILSVRDQLKAAEASVDAAKSGLYPRLQLGLGQGWLKKDSAATTKTAPLNLNLNYSVFDFGGVNRSIEGAAAREESVRANITYEESKTLLEMLEAILDIQRTNKLLFFAKGYVESRKAFEDVIREKESLGAASKVDIIRATTKRIESEAQVTVNQRVLEEAVARYTALFGVAPRLGSTFFGLPVRDIIPLVKNFDPLNHPLSNSAKAELKARRADLEKIKASRRGSINIDISNASGQVGANQTTYGISYSNYLFDGGARAAEERRAAAVLSQASYDLIASQRDVKGEVETLSAAYLAAVRDLSYKASILKGARATDSATKDLFLLSRGTITDVFRAQEDYFSSIQQAINAQYQVHKNLYQFLHSVSSLQKYFSNSI
jgi:outer membrane protein TolC